MGQRGGGQARMEPAPHDARRRIVASRPHPSAVTRGVPPRPTWRSRQASFAFSRLWKNSLLHVRDDVPGTQLPRKPEVFMRGKMSGGLFPRAVSGRRSSKPGPASVSSLPPVDLTLSSAMTQPPRLRKSRGFTHAVTTGPGVKRPGRSSASLAITGSGSATRSG